MTGSSHYVLSCIKTAWLSYAVGYYASCYSYCILLVEIIIYARQIDNDWKPIDCYFQDKDTNMHFKLLQPGNDGDFFI